MSYETFQMEKYGNILKADGKVTEAIENGLEQQQQLIEWFELQAELQLMEKENN